LGPTHKHWAPKLRATAVLFCLLAKKVRTKQDDYGALVVEEHIRNSRYRLRPLTAAPLVAHRRHLIVVPKPIPAAPLVVLRRYLIAVPRLLPAAPLGVRRGYMIVVSRTLHAAPVTVCRRYLIMMPRPLPRYASQGKLSWRPGRNPSEPCRHLIAMPRPSLAEPLVLRHSP
jgi:hypothetical protein